MRFSTEESPPFHSEEYRLYPSRYQEQPAFLVKLSDWYSSFLFVHIKAIFKQVRDARECGLFIRHFKDELHFCTVFCCQGNHTHNPFPCHLVTQQLCVYCLL